MRFLTSVLVIVFLLTPLRSQVVHEMDFNRFTNYRLEDWITYAPALIITSIDISEDFAYFGTRYGGILRYDLYENRWLFPFTTSSGLRSNEIVKVVYDYKDFRLYALTSEGIDVFDPGSNHWKPAYIDDISELSRRSPSQQEVQDFFNSQSDYRYPEFFRPSDRQLPEFFTSVDYLYRPPDEILDKHNRVFHFTDRVVDQWRNIWIGTNGLGAARADLDDRSLNFYPQSLTNIHPKDISFKNAEIWIGGHSFGPIPHGIARWQSGRNKWQYFDERFYYGIYNDEVNVIASGRQHVFLGTNEGLVIYNYNNNEWRTLTTAHGLESNLIRDIKLQNDILFIASEEGFNWLRPPYKQVEESQDNRLDNVPINYITTTDTSVYFATYRGLFTYHPAEDSIQFFQVSAAVSDIGITVIANHNDSLWIGGASGIAFRSNKTRQWRSFTRIPEYIPGRINDIDFTPGHVWFATDNGLLKYQTAMDHWYLYTERDGLADDRVYHIDVDQSDLWLSTRKGVTIFRWDRPDRIE